MTFFSELEELMESNACHAALMLFVRTVDVEVAQTDHRSLYFAFGHLGTQYLVEKELGVAVDIKRTFKARIFYKGCACSIGCGR